MAIRFAGKWALRLDRVDTIRRACEELRSKGVTTAGALLRAENPFVASLPENRRYSELQSLQVFLRDGFIDRYSGQRLVFPGVLRLLSKLLPSEFPFHPNWKMAETHPAYWELFPTIDHVIPISRGGADNDSNWVTTSMLRNSAKANRMLEEFGWTLMPPGSLADWDGLEHFFLEFVDSDSSLLEDEYLRRWHRAIARLSEHDREDRLDG